MNQLVGLKYGFKFVVMIFGSYVVGCWDLSCFTSLNFSNYENYTSLSNFLQ